LKLISYKEKSNSISYGGAQKKLTEKKKKKKKTQSMIGAKAIRISDSNTHNQLVYSSFPKPQGIQIPKLHSKDKEKPKSN
jgi:hypothetical protein